MEHKLLQVSSHLFLVIAVPDKLVTLCARWLLEVNMQSPYTLAPPILEEEHVQKSFLVTAACTAESAAVMATDLATQALRAFEELAMAG